LLTTALVFVDGAIFGAVFATISLVALMRYVLNDSRESPAAREERTPAAAPPQR
jgi:hypothetical protein